MSKVSIVTLNNVSVTFKNRLKTASLKRLLLTNNLEGRESNILRKHALDNVNLELFEGDIVGIVGKNGAGKTTLCKVLTGVYKPQHGSVSITGKVNTLLSLNSFFLQELTGTDNIYLVGSLLGKGKDEIADKLSEIIKFSELEEAINIPVETYSKGMQSRLAFSIATAFDPDILVIDEMLSVGDKAFRKKCRVRLKEMIKSARLIVLVSHNDSDFTDFCNRLILMDKGRILMDDNVKQVLEEYNLKFG